jgi:hypothetical protein
MTVSLATYYKCDGWKLTQDDKGMTGTVIYIVDYTAIFDATLPEPGSTWYINGYSLPYLKCKNAEWDSLGGDLVQCTYHYSTDRQLSATFFEASLSYESETVDMTRGYTWETAGNPVTINIPTEVPVAIYTVKIKNESTPRNAVASAQKCLNSKIFHGFPIENLRFDGCNTDASYTLSGGELNVVSTYKFTAKTQSHNYCWRQPQISVDDQGNQQYWQNTDSTNTATYTTTSALVGSPVYVSGVPGTGGWDKPILSGNYRYPTCDFAAVLGLPTIAGDG